MVCEGLASFFVGVFEINNDTRTNYMYKIHTILADSRHRSTVINMNDPHWSNTPNFIHMYNSKSVT